MTTHPSSLAAFLRSRRERLKPEQVGLASHGRRRTPGLRRAELATLAGLSVEYLERLEQGRDTNPSGAVLTALADALRLSRDEKQHLALLAMRQHSATLLPAPPPVGDDPRPGMRDLLDRLDPTPSCLLGPVYDVVAWNAAWETAATPLGVLDTDPPNLVRYHFLHPLAHRTFDDASWASTADEAVGWLRAAEPDWGSDGAFRALIEDVQAVPEFAARWATHVVASRQPASKRIWHPGAGHLNLRLEVLFVGEANHWLQLWLPSDEEAATALGSLLRTRPSPAPHARLAPATRGVEA
ncbi:helix-turn-helix domain-containing protein [Streptomyces noursei]|uniref:helix-turn-helix domain-containing protein n=1 Tax=Streptomyces noursei TaxID=1971 RepID=UPI001674C90C|nr:helix-turn-helix transcriptional regulator [Streptomyces noursei]MCZ1020468.1 helix-turn-helix transcriptional regulator [Streptomyces noursei]GGX13582.1 transcriptional regulator [Streptomyces noursei]